MKGKLHKMVSGYILSLNGDIDDPYAIVNKELAEDYGWYKLSLKNCQAIERGYDLDELAKIEYPICEVWNDEEALIRELAFKKGFQKALELMGDKKFSEEDLMEAYSRGQTNSPIQSLQQTEWDVEVETVPALSNNGNVYYGDIPKLDENNCLILKRI
jgi:uncharacterized protein YktA (UPF0223 family)